MLVELKNGETFNGHLVNCDNFMNITLREVYQTSPEGDRFWKLRECYIRGSTIKYLRVPEALLEEVREEQLKAREASKGTRGAVPGGRGRGAVQRVIPILVVSGRGSRGGPVRGGRGGRGRGLCDEKDISVKGLETVKKSTRVYLESYTSILLVQKERLESFYGKELILADRDMVETASDEILRDAATVDVSLLVVGDPFGGWHVRATTHTDILLRARSLGIPYRVIHNASIMSAVGTSGLQLYNFGQTVSIPFFTDNWKPDSWYNKIAENSKLGMHTLVLLDIKVKEQSEENLARGRKIYEPPRYMTIPVAVAQLREVEETRQEGYLDPGKTIAVGLSRIGAGDDQRIVSGTLEDLHNADIDVFGEPLHSMVIVGKRLHHLEAEYLRAYAINKENWNYVVENVYQCKVE
ncbi:diphthine synthase [Clathrus columnatus]|uniref:diphthine methyl ester synthase n=1 Tax=Clathrus columnatus TaxID=1419009 RepID=A0AAV5A2C4_9AGAM|nr:diphthine synthase [Clathrus columnatus]